jgi:hypothetical protein
MPVPKRHQHKPGDVEVTSVMKQVKTLICCMLFVSVPSTVLYLYLQHQSHKALAAALANCPPIAPPEVAAKQ